MRNYFIFFGLLVLLTIWFKGSGNDLDDHFRRSEAVFSEIIGNASKEIAIDYHMSLIGRGGSEDSQGISLISLTFIRKEWAVLKNDGRLLLRLQKNY